MKQNKTNKCDSRCNVVPSWLYCVYISFGILDLYTTFLASPDLSYEANPVVRYFKWSWQELTIWYVSNVVIMIVITKLSDSYIVAYLKKQKSKRILLYISVFIIVCFFGNIIQLIYAPINNYLGYLYLQSKEDNIFFSLASLYVTFQCKFHYLIYYYLVNSIWFLIGVIIAVFRMLYVKRFCCGCFIKNSI
jgi:hypothetical protein